jgi:Effector Associated Constant Component 1
MRHGGKIICDGFWLCIGLLLYGTVMTDTSLTVSLSADIPNAWLAQFTRDLERDLSRAGIQTRPVELPPVPGEKGEPITLGMLALALIASGTVKAMIECFKAYLSRERTLTIKLSPADGTPVEVTARNVDTPALREALEAIVSARSG